MCQYHCIRSLDECFSQLQFVKQKQHFGFLLNIRWISKNSATAESEMELRVNVNKCNQFSQTLRLLKKLTFVVLIRMRKSCVIKWLLNKLLTATDHRLWDLPRSHWYRCHLYQWLKNFLLFHFSRFCVIFTQRVFVNVFQMCRLLYVFCWLCQWQSQVEIVHFRTSR